MNNINRIKENSFLTILEYFLKKSFAVVWFFIFFREVVKIEFLCMARLIIDLLIFLYKIF